MLLLYIIIGLVIAYLVIKPFIYNEDKEVKYDKLEEFRKNANGKPFCPRCGCTEIGIGQHFNKAGSDTFNVCKNCGFRYRPKDKYR